MSQTIYLARHGETEWNRQGRWQGHSDTELNDFGRAQARALAEALAGLRLERVCASDLARARETAVIVANALGLGPVRVDAGLRERCFGVFEGLTGEECSLRHPEEWASYRSSQAIPTGAEAPSTVAQRMRDAVFRLATLHGESRAILIVSHGAAIRAFLNTFAANLVGPIHNGATFSVVHVDGRFSDVTSVR
jgi:broad specificity phosphatase PhoE